MQVPLVFPQVKEKTSHGKLLMGTYSEKGKGGSQAHFLVVDLNNGGIKDIPMEYPLHSFELNPLDPNEVFGMSKWTKEIYIFDLKNMKINRTIDTGSIQELFVGHGIFSPDGNLFYASSSIYQNEEKSIGKGWVNIYETRSGKKVGSFPSEGIEPHMSILMKNGREILISNAGYGPEFYITGYKKPKRILPSLTIIDINSGKLINKKDLKNEKISIPHMSSNSHAEIFLAGGKEVGNSLWKPAVFKLNNDLNLNPLKIDDPAIQEPMMSPLVDNEGKYACAASPFSDKIYFWNFKTGNLVKEIMADKPFGVSFSLDKKLFVVSCNKKILFIDGKGFKIKKTISLGDFKPKGHILVI